MRYFSIRSKRPIRNRFDLDMTPRCLVCEGLKECRELTELDTEDEEGEIRLLTIEGYGEVTVSERFLECMVKCILSGRSWPELFDLFKQTFTELDIQNAASMFGY